MALKVKAVEKKVKFSKDNSGTIEDLENENNGENNGGSSENPTPTPSNGGGGDDPVDGD